MDQIRLCVGVDGCPAGWCAATREPDGELRLTVAATAAELLDSHADAAVLAIDIPVGLSAAGRRGCDTAARALLGHPRATSVFPAPIRPALHCRTRAEASRVTEKLDGRGVGAQAFFLYAKIAEVDAELAARPGWRERVREAHPEVSFAAMNGGKSLVAGKKTEEGARLRRNLLARWLGRRAVNAVLRDTRTDLGLRRRDLADDDLLDTLAVLWTAERIARGEATVLPDEPLVDPTGLSMRITY